MAPWPGPQPAAGGSLSVFGVPVGVSWRGPGQSLGLSAVQHTHLGSTEGAKSAWREAAGRPAQDPSCSDCRIPAFLGAQIPLCPTPFSLGLLLGDIFAGAGTLLEWYVQERGFFFFCSSHLLFQQVSERRANSKNCQASSGSCALSSAYQLAIRALTRRGSVACSSERP